MEMMEFILKILKMKINIKEIKCMKMILLMDVIFLIVMQDLLLDLNDGW